MAKAKSAFVCTECGAEYRKWQGQCTSCREWNSISEVRLAPARPGAAASTSGGRSGYAGGISRDVTDLASVDLTEVPRLSSTFGEFDRVLGGGLVPGSAVLLGGHPGAGGYVSVTYAATLFNGQRITQYFFYLAQ